MEENEDDVEKNPESKLWNVVKHCKVIETSSRLIIPQADSKNESAEGTKGYRLLPNDVIKLGRVRFKIREIISPAYHKRQMRAASNLGKRSHQESFDNNCKNDLSKNMSKQEIGYSPDVKYGSIEQ